MMEVELDIGEIVLKQNEELNGEILLLSEYSLNNIRTADTNNDLSVMTRPVTPLSLRQSQNLTRKRGILLPEWISIPGKGTDTVKVFQIED